MSAKKNSKLIINLITCISILIVFFVTDDYPRHIIIFGEGFSLVNTIYNFVLNFIFSAILINIFSLHSSLFSNDAFHIRDKKERNKIILKVFAILAIQIICDTLLAFVITTDGCNYILKDTVLVLQWISLYLILVNKEILKNKKHNIAVVILFAIIMVISFAWDIDQLHSYRILIQKYMTDSPYVLRCVKNTDFIHSVKTIIMDIILICGLILIHGISNRSVKNEDDDATRNVVIFKTLVRIDIMGAAFIIIAVIKIAIYPQSFLVSGEAGGYAQTNNRENGEFNITCDNYAYKRGFGTILLDNSEYSKRRISLQKDVVNVSFSFNGQESEFVIGGDRAGMIDGYKFVVNNQTVYLYGNYAISYYEGYVPKLVQIKELNKLDYNPIVIGLCEQLIEKGNVFIFEYGAEYLIEFDKDFIIPYIERYANGEFTSDELKWMETSYYRIDYIEKIATNLKK